MPGLVGMIGRSVNPKAHVFVGPLNPGETLIVQYLSNCWRWGCE